MTTVTLSAHELAERRLGRKLRHGELHLDIEGYVGDLEAGKRALREAIEKEKRRAIQEYLRGHRITLRLTPEMTRILRALKERGRAHARAEMQSMGVTPVRQYADTPRMTDLEGLLAQHLDGIALRIDREYGTVAATVPYSITGTMAREIDRLVPGALNAASQIVSGAMADGLGEVFGENDGEFAGFMYSAVMDDGTCDECAGWDGEEFGSWDDIQTVLPDGGPNPDCYGGGRCRCRAVPIPYEGGGIGQGAVAAPPGWSVNEELLLPPYARIDPNDLGPTEAAAMYKRLKAHHARIVRTVQSMGRKTAPGKIVATERRLRELELRAAGVKAKSAPTPPRKTIKLPPASGPRAAEETIFNARTTELQRVVLGQTGHVRAQRAKDEIMRLVSARLEQNSDFGRLVETGVRRYVRDLDLKPGDTLAVEFYGKKLEGKILGKLSDGYEFSPTPESLRRVKGFAGNPYKIENFRQVWIEKDQIQTFLPTPTYVPKNASESEGVVSILIENWAGTSGDHDPWAVALQEAARREFGLDDATVAHFKERKSYTGKDTWSDAMKVLDAHEPGIRAFLRAMWDNTQARLKKAGITEVTVWRGSSINPVGMEVGKAYVDQEVRLQPMSSFSTSFLTAGGFANDEEGAGIVMAVKVPAARVIGTARSGFGCLNEQEFVLLGSPRATDRITVYVPRNPSYDVSRESFWEAVREAERMVPGEDLGSQFWRGKAIFPAKHEKLLEDRLFISEGDLKLKHVEHAMDDLALVPIDTLRAITDPVDYDAPPLKLYFGRGKVPDLDGLGFLKGKKVSKGGNRLWDDVSAAYHPEMDVIVVGESRGGSVSPVLHELGHAANRKLMITEWDGEFMSHRERLFDAGKLNPYLRGRKAYDLEAADEMFSESFAIYFRLGKQSLVKAFDKEYADYFVQLVNRLS